MVRHTVGIVAFTVLLASSGQAASGRIVGVVAGVRQSPTVQIDLKVKGYAPQVRVDGRSPSSVQMVKTVTQQAVHADDQTAYTKWATDQPWQEDARTDAAALAVGRCVEVQLRAGSKDVAEVVRINAEHAGSAFDPCKSLRGR